MSGKIDTEPTARTAVALVALLAISAGAADVTATTTEAKALNVPSEDAFVVSVSDDGDAEVSLVTTFNLTADAEKRAFERFRRNETERRTLRQQFAGNLRHVIEAVDNRTERDMGSANPSVTVTTAGNGTTGVVAVTVTWRNLAAERDGSLVVEQPFASGFRTERTFVLRAPDGYAFAEVTPTADTNRDATATWTANSSLDGFRAVMQSTDEGLEQSSAESDGEPQPRTSEETADGASGSMPGFGVVAAFAALVASVVLALRL
ncbi:DUF7345 domain-containing protein [Halorussus sp. AFM4]|uniref:DUF7345 domain-containing protein n=1 Tax=Halorussus sp. AFM4 TaxID=3421651 RepID=UPI003EBDFC97